MIRRLCEIMAIDISRLFATDPEEDARSVPTLSPAALLEISRLLADLEQPVADIGRLSSLLEIETAKLKRLFRNSTGQTLQSFVEQARFDRVREWLDNREIPLKQVAYLSGFASHSSFAYAFKCRTGQTPRQYRYRST